jgi:heterodisulfide reductase subunit C
MQQIVFLIITSIAFYVAFRQFRQLYQNIHLGQKDDSVTVVRNGIRNVLLVAFGQQKMFSNWMVAVLHGFIYLAFLITQIEFIEIITDGFTGSHRIFAPVLGSFYGFVISLIECLSLLALIATFIFLSRRNLLKIPRFTKSELMGWPALDANIILMLEILLVAGIFTMNGADVLLQKIDSVHYPATGNLAISSVLGPWLFGGLDVDSLMVLERNGWWLHYLVVLGFLVYLPHSKHLHIFLAFPNVYFEKQAPRGKMDNMPIIMNEVKSMLGMASDISTTATDTMQDFGASDVFGLSTLNLLNAYSCTECGRCTAVCPANLTGKKLSPRKIMMDIRDRADEVGKKILTGATANAFDDGKNLFDYISKEEIFACTTCNACVEACPVLINPLDPILKLRRYAILSQSEGPADWMPMFTAMENSGSVWAMSTDRDAWKQDT